MNTTESVSFKFDKKNYNLGDTATLVATDPDANVNPDEINTISVKITSDHDPNGVIIQLTETDVNTGIFKGTLTLADVSSETSLIVQAGDKIGLQYEAPQRARMKVSIGGVSQAGSVEMTDYKISEEQLKCCIGFRTHWWCSQIWFRQCCSGF